MSNAPMQPNPNGPTMRLSEAYRKMSEATRAFHVYLVETGAVRTCGNCDHMTDATGECGLYRVRPPVPVILYSCGPGWVDRIPF